MYWNKVKTVLIIVFAAANIFFIYNLYTQYVTRNFISEKAIEDTVAILEKSGISITDGVLPEKKLKEVVISCNYDEDYYVNTLFRLTGSDNYTSYIKSGALGQSVKFTVKETNDILEFFDSFYLRYIKNSGEENFESEITNYITNISGENYDGLSALDNETMATYEAVSQRKQSELEKILNTIPLVSSESNIARAQLSISSCAFDNNTNRYLLNCEENVNGYPVYDAGAFIIIENDEITYISGNLIFFDPITDYSTKLYDQLDALFAEKAYIEENNEKNNNYLINAFEVVYCINWYSDRSAYYIIPAWKIVYSDGTIRVRNALNCSIYNI